jgi:hypothetical protein
VSTPSRSLRCDRLAKDQPAEIAMFQISEVQESPAFNGRRSVLTLRGPHVAEQLLLPPSAVWYAQLRTSRHNCRVRSSGQSHNFGYR